jgi:Thrombospondin C-terminal region
MRSLKKIQFTAPIAALATCFCAHAATTPIDLGTWSQYGPKTNGTWTVGASGTSVVQSKNGEPTFFVSSEGFSNAILRGQIRVASNAWDDDYIGFVMGYNSPLNTSKNMDLLLLDWRKTEAGAQKEGFAIARVQGEVTDYTSSGFFNRTSSSTFDILETNYGAGLGWHAGTDYNFEIMYMSDRVTVNVSGGQFSSPTAVIDVAGTFQEGRFGFYNYSQESVTYSSYTVQSAPVPEADASLLTLAGIFVAGLSSISRNAANAKSRMKTNKIADDTVA